MGADPRSEFGRQLDEVRAAAGNPNLAQLSRYRDQDPDMWSRPQLRVVLAGEFTRAPEWERVWAFVQACLRHAGSRATPHLLALADDGVWRTRHTALVRVLEALPASAHTAPADTELVRVGAPPMLADCYQLRSTLTERLHQTVTTTTVVSGPGGTGKTQLAASFAADRWRDPGIRVALWASGRSRDAIVTAYAQAAFELLKVQPDDSEHAAARFLAWMASTEQRWLIILDDLQRPEDLRDLWPPASSTGHTVVTTRRRDPSLFRGDRPLLPVDVFTEQEANDYLRAKLADQPHLVDGVEGLASDLGYLPLALSQAVAYLTNRSLTCRQYRTRLADKRRSLRQVLPEPGELTDDYGYTVAATFALSIDLANTLEPVGVASRVMLLASLLDPVGIPNQLFTTSALVTHVNNSLNRKVDADDIEDAVWLLHRLSLLSADIAVPQRETRVHALVQRATREAADEQDSTIVVAAAKAAGYALIAVWPEIERDRVLAESLRSNTDALQIAAEPALWSSGAHPVLIRAGQSRDKVGLVHSALTYYQKLLEAAQKYLPVNHPDTVNIRHSLVLSRGQAGDPAGAAEALTDLAEAVADEAGIEDHNKLTIRYNRAIMRGESGDPVGAVAGLSEVLQEMLRSGANHAGIPDTMEMLVYWTGKAGSPQEAAAALAHLVDARARALGPEHPDTLKSRTNLVFWRGEAGDLVGAAAACSELVDAMVRVLGADHPDTISARHNLAYLIGESGDPSGAAAASAELLSDSIRALGRDHPRTLIVRSGAARWIGEVGDPAKAADAFAGLLEDRKRLLGPHHPDTKLARQALAYWRRETKRGRRG